jgi:hypothetical protein
MTSQQQKQQQDNHSPWKDMLSAISNDDRLYGWSHLITGGRTRRGEHPWKDMLSAVII